MEYIRLTKEIKDVAGQSVITCKFKGTDKCLIHNGGNCGNCNVFNKMLEQLNGFEKLLEESLSER